MERSAAAGDAVAGELVERASEWRSRNRSRAEAEIVCENPYVAFWPRFLSPFECAYVIAVARGALRPWDVIDADTGKQMESGVRVSETAWWRPAQMDPVLECIFRKTVTAFDGRAELAEPMSVVRYRPGGNFMAHVDAYKNYHSGELDETARATTSIVYLNDGI